MSGQGGVGGCTTYPTRISCQAISYTQGQPTQMYMNPVSQFKALFPNGVVRTASVATTAATASTLPKASANRSVLDNSVDAIKRMQAKVGPSDKQRIDDFYSSFRALETSLGIGDNPMPGMTPTPPPTQANQCVAGYQPPAALNNEDSNGSQMDYASRLQAFIDITVLAFKCDAARTLALSFESEAGLRILGNMVPKELIYGQEDVSQGNLDTHLSMSHWSSASGTPGPGSPQQRSDRCVTRDRFYINYFMSMIAQLKAAKDPSGSSILDNTAIIIGHGFADGSHTTGPNAAQLPLALGGGRNFLKTGNLIMGNNKMAPFLATLGNRIAGLSSYAGSQGGMDI